MRRLILALLILAGPCFAQKSNGDTVVGTFTASDNGTCQSSSSCAWMVFPAQGFTQNALVYSTGTWSGTVSVQVGSGGIWKTISTNTSNFTATNVAPSGTTDIRVLMIGYASGTAIVTISRNLSPNTTTIHFPGAAAGSCTKNQQAVNDATGDFSTCSGAGSWVSISGGGTAQTIANGTSALGTSAIGSGACATVVTATATGVATTDDIMADFNADPTSTTGYSPSANGMLTIIKYPTSGNVNFKVCNNTASSVTPGAVTLNWRVVR